MSLTIDMCILMDAMRAAFGVLLGDIGAGFLASWMEVYIYSFAGRSNSCARSSSVVP